MRRLLFFLHSLSAGGAERVTATLANHWARKGWVVTVVTVTGASTDFYELDARIRRIPLDMAADSRHIGEAVWHNLRRIRVLSRVLKREKPDVAVSMMATANVTLALAGRLAGVPAIGSERIHPPTLPLGRMWEASRRRAYPLLAGMVAQTPASAAWIEAHSPADRIRVIPNPVRYPVGRHAPYIDPVEVKGSLAGERLVIAVGRLDHQKGFDRLLAAWAPVIEEHSDWSLVLLGEGVEREALIEQAKAFGIHDRVALPGAVGNLGDWYEAADCYALTSRFEGFPNALLEALAHGVPSVAVDCDTGPREILRHEVDGLLVPQDDPEALGEALDRMMGDADLRARFAERAVEARDRCAVESIAGQWEALFDEVVRAR
ncbi:glycosyltransferase family 4 protein [Spiribacter sp. 1M153]|uniref:glycosyltransferase family 4 protein n=1 Tax=Spiribacter roseus TaxID=1855875 RepID=UPI00349F2B32